MTHFEFPLHPGRYDLANELHARPFPDITAPCQALCLAFFMPNGGAHDHLIKLLDKFGMPPPDDAANHFFGDIGRCRLKWERHTEFVTYTFFRDGQAGFAPAKDLFPADWARMMPGELLSASIVSIEPVADHAFASRLSVEFVTESLAVCDVLDGAAQVATDFRVDANGFTRFLLSPQPDTGKQRLGRIMQRLVEIENYKAMAMLALPVARKASSELGTIDRRLSEVVTAFAGQDGDHETNLNRLLQISADIEHLIARHSERFSAARAYAAIVSQRVAVLRERRVAGRQTLAEFMLRRFEPAMRTCEATNMRLNAAAARAARAGDMLRTRADYVREAQNQGILARMDERAATALRLQETVEGLSVVAVTYYAVNLASYFLAPATGAFGISKVWLTAGLVPPVMMLVWMFIKRIKNRMKN